MTGIKIIHGSVGKDPRRSPRSHSWRQPRESVVAGLIGESQLTAILQSSVNAGLPIQISGMPQVYAYKGSLVATRLGEGYGFARAIVEMLRPDAMAAATGGFANLGDVLAKGSVAANNEARQWSKVGATGVIGVGSSLWRLTGNPAAGSVGGALATGTNTDRTTTGALGQANPTSGYTKHFVGGFVQASVNANGVLLMDRIWHGAPAMNSSGTQTVTHTLTRYVSTGASGLSRGNVAIMEVGGTVLAGTAHNNTITYVDDNGNSAEAAAAFAGRSAAAVDTHDHPVGGSQFFPLNAGDVGISDITVYQCSATVATGVMNLVVAHPIAFMPANMAYAGALIDGINSDVSLEEILTDACLCFAELPKPATTATTYLGTVRMIQGNAA